MSLYVCVGVHGSLCRFVCLWVCLGLSVGVSGCVCGCVWVCPWVCVCGCVSLAVYSHNVIMARNNNFIIEGFELDRRRNIRDIKYNSPLREFKLGRALYQGKMA